jgi:hypothetical protein
MMDHSGRVADSGDYDRVRYADIEGPSNDRAASTGSSV